MIIGNNNPTSNSNFMKNVPNTPGSSNDKPHALPERKAAQINANVMNKNDMADKSFAMLQERYANGLISLEEFTKQCNKLNKLRQK